MMGNIKIKLMSDLCAGNGESVGYGVDSDICADIYGFPYIPGKRILGCLRDAAICLQEFDLPEANKENIEAIFGNENGKEGKLRIGNAVVLGNDSLHSYIHALKNEKNRDYLIRQCTEEKVLRLYSSVRGQTKIGADGKAEGGSLRFARVLNQYDPTTGDELEFVCPVDTADLNDEQIDLVKKSCKTLHHIGLNRTRGLGNILVMPDLKGDDCKDPAGEIRDLTSKTCEQIRVKYQVEFDSPIIIQEYLENGGQINARTMIGLFSGIYMREHKKADADFEDLFLNGTVKWSALTPVIHDIWSNPVPFMIMKLKNGGGKLENSFTPRDMDWKKKKPKSLDGYFASYDDRQKKLYVSQPETETNYHNRIQEADHADRTKKGLYMQEALKQGMIYGGYIILPKERAEDIKKLLRVGKIHLGRSKKVQYGMASVTNIIMEDFCPEKIAVEDNETVAAILRSDLVLQDGAMFTIDPSFVRATIAKATGLENKIPEGMQDICRYHVLTGYHAMWQMQKPKIQAVMGGSVYCFTGKKGEYPATIVIGEYQQEGMGQIELVPLSKLNEMKDISYGKIAAKTGDPEEERVSFFEQRLLYEAAMAEIKEYAFRFKKADDKKPDEYRILKKVPSGRIRQMLMEAKDIADLRTMIDSMKTSDVSSESIGKKAASEKLVDEFYGKKTAAIDLEKMIGDQALWEEVKKKPDVLDKLSRNWKEPMLTLLHMVHYQKGRR